MDDREDELIYGRNNWRKSRKKCPECKVHLVRRGGCRHVGSECPKCGYFVREVEAL